MQIVQLLLIAFSTAALVRAWQATRGTALFHAVQWGIAAWLAWTAAIVLRSLPQFAPANDQHPDPVIYLALCLTACSGVAVLGARRPHVAAWDFVVLGLFAVMVLPLVEAALIGARSLDWLRLTFLAATIGIGVLNYLPTRFAPAAFLVGLGCAAELVTLAAPTALPAGLEADAVRLCILAAPALAWVRLIASGPYDELDCVWIDFRDRWGVVWGQRVREQFNRAAAHAKWPVTLTWFGFQFQNRVDEEIRVAMRETLDALLQRFAAQRVSSDQKSFSS